MDEQRKIMRGTAGSYILRCPECDREHFRQDFRNLPNEFCVWCGTVKLEPVYEMEAEIERLRAALGLCDGRCSSLHHAKKHQHEIGDTCPVEAIITEALKR